MDYAHKAAKIMLDACAFDPAKFYGHVSSLSVGAGVLYSGILFSQFDKQDEVFDTVEGLVYVLTHECDVDQRNERNFNEAVLVCPILKLDEWVSEFVESKSDGELFGMIPAIAKNNVYRVFYLPPVPKHIDQHILPFGGLIYLNQITNTHVSCFNNQNCRPICALSTYGASLLDWKLQNHLFRPKSESLPRLH